MDSKIHSGNGDHDAEQDKREHPQPVFSIAQCIRDDGLVEGHDCEAMAWGVAKIFRTEPLPVLNPGVVPYGPRLLEGLFEKRDDVCDEKEVR